MNRVLISILIGVISGVLSGFQGISGAFYIMAFLLYFNVVKTHNMAAGTTLFSLLFPISLGAVWAYYKKGDVDIPIAIVIFISYMISSYLGAFINYYYKVPDSINYLSISILMFLSSIYFLHKSLTH